MVSLSLCLYKAQRVLLFSEHLHVLMLIDVTFHNNAAAPGLFFRMAIKDLSYLFGQLKQRGFFIFFKANQSSLSCGFQAMSRLITLSPRQRRESRAGRGSNRHFLLSDAISDTKLVDLQQLGEMRGRREGGLPKGDNTPTAVVCL